MTFIWNKPWPRGPSRVQPLIRETEDLLLFSMISQLLRDFSDQINRNWSQDTDPGLFS